MSGHRQAALALYALGESDQGAILAELPADDQAVLRALLAELAELGFDKAANHGAMTLEAPAPVRTDASDILMTASAPDMLALLRNEPPALVAQLLSLRSFAWAPALLDLLPADRRALVRAALEGGIAAAPARDKFLLEAIAAALRAHVPAAAPQTRRAPPSLSKWLPWTR